MIRLSFTDQRGCVKAPMGTATSSWREQLHAAMVLLDVDRDAVAERYDPDVPRRLRIIGLPSTAPMEEGVAEVGDLRDQQDFIDAEALVAPLRRRQARGMGGLPPLSTPKVEHPRPGEERAPG